MVYSKGKTASLIIFFVLVSGFGKFAFPQAEAGAVRRITTSIDNSETVTLAGQVHYLARRQFDRGEVAPDLPMDRINLLLRGTPEQETALQQLLIEQQDPNSPKYHQWLTPEQFGEKFGASVADLQTITNWLSQQGFHDIVVGKGRRSIEFSGTATQVEQAFHTEIHKFSANGTAFIANSKAPTIPVAFAPVIRGFASLNNYPHRASVQILKRAPVAIRRGADATPQFNLASGGNALGPGDFATIYNVAPLWKKGVDGTGQSIAVVGRSGLYGSDPSSFRNIFGMPPEDWTMIVNGGDPGVGSTGDVVEASLDIEWAGAVAKNAKIYYVATKSTNASDGVDLSAQYVVDHNLAGILSVSYGFCEAEQSADTFYQMLWQQAAAQGISVFVSAGDSGSAGCDDPTVKSPSTHGLAVSGLASTPDNVAVGGTALNDAPTPSVYWSATNDATKASALSYIPETTWNDSSSTSIHAGSGGVSSIYATPVWQSGAGVPTSDPGATGQHHRYLPDVSLSAAGHVPYLVCAMSSCSMADSNGQLELYQVYGTSVSSPAFAGIMALVDQSAGGRQGNPNFHFYPLAQTAGIFHDITTGTNAVPCSSGTGCSNGVLSGYAAGLGYDLATGWGSVDANALVNNWSNVSFLPSSITASATPTSFVHGSALNFTATVSTSSGTPSGVVDAYEVQNNTTTELGSAVLANGVATGSTTKAPGGSGNLYLRYTGDGIYGSSVSTAIPINVTLEGVNVTMDPPSKTLALGEFTGTTVTVAAQSGNGTPTGTVNLTYGGKTLTQETLNNGAAPLVEGWSPPGVGTYQLNVNYSGDDSYYASTTQWPLTFTQGKPSVILFCNNLGHDVVAGTSVPCNANVPTVFGPPASGTIQFTDNNAAIGSALSYTGSNVTLDIGTLPTGAHNIGAQYSGDTNYLPNSANPWSTINVVSKGTVGLQINGPNTQKPGSGSNLYLFVSAMQLGPSLNGTATLYDDSTVLATYQVSGGGSQWSMTTYFNTATAAMATGTHPLKLSYTGDPTYADATSKVFNLLISNPDFTITGLNDITLKQGDHWLSYPTIQPISGLIGPVDLSCTGAPSEATCTIDSPAQINSTPSLKITTTAPQVGWNHSAWENPFVFAMLPFAGMLAGFSRMKRRRKLLWICLFVVALALSMTSCGGGGGSSSSPSAPSGGTKDPGTPTGTYTLTITATYGTGTSAITHSYPFKLTVQ